MHVCAESHPSCLTLYNPMCHSLPSNLVYGIPQARILEWVAMPSSRGSSQTRDRTPELAGRFFATGTTWEAQRYIQFSSVYSLSRVQLFVIPWTTAHQASLSITNSRSLLRLMSIELVMPSNHLILCCPLLLLPSIFPSIRVFSNESVLHQVAKVLEFQVQHQSFQ